MRAGRILRQIVRSRIIAQVPALTGVYDRATESSLFPYGIMGPSSWIGDIADCVPMREVTMQIDVFDRLTSKGIVEDIVDDVATALDGWSDTSQLTMHKIRVPLARVVDDPDGKSAHGIIQIEVIVEGTSAP